MHEGHEPKGLADLRHGDALTSEDMTEVHLAAAEQSRPQPVTMMV